MTNSTITTKISAAFLATVLVAGIIAVISPSFMMGAQAQEYGMEDRYSNQEESDYGMDSYEEKSYGSEPDYGMDSYEEKSYGSEPDYGMDSYEEKSYGNEPDYGTDSYGQKAYGNDDYKSQYSSYGKDDRKDDREKAKDSVSIKKVKCNNINLNLNGLNITSGGSANGGANGGANSAADASDSISANGYGNDDRKKKVVDKKDGFTFVCINNNNNNVTVSNVSGGAPTPTTPVEDECEECFDNLTVDLKRILADALRDGFTIGPLVIDAGSSIADLCDELREVGPIELTAGQIIGFIFEERIFQEADIFSLIELLLCLQNLDLVDIDLFSIFRTLQDQGLISQDSTVPATPVTPTTP
jgi:hypothetical protein